MTRMKTERTFAVEIGVYGDGRIDVTYLENGEPIYGSGDSGRLTAEMVAQQAIKSMTDRAEAARFSRVARHLEDFDRAENLRQRAASLDAAVAPPYKDGIVPASRDQFHREADALRLEANMILSRIANSTPRYICESCGFPNGEGAGRNCASPTFHKSSRSATGESER